MNTPTVDQLPPGTVYAYKKYYSVVEYNKAKIGEYYYFYGTGDEELKLLYGKLSEKHFVSAVNGSNNPTNNGYYEYKMLRKKNDKDDIFTVYNIYEWYNLTDNNGGGKRSDIQKRSKKSRKQKHRVRKSRRNRRR